MKRTLMAAAAVGGLMLSAALAQSPAPNTSANPSDSQSTQSAPAATPAPATSGAAAKVVTQQSPDQWLASKFKGTNVIGADDAKIGDVSDILFDKSGKVDAVIVGVGGFLGIGTKDVALPLSSFQVVPGANGAPDKLRLSMTKEQLKEMAEFKPLSAPATTTGSAPPPRPSTPMSPPASNR